MALGPLHGLAGHSCGFFAAVGAELDEKPGVAFVWLGKEFEAGHVLAGETGVFDDLLVQAFDGDGAELLEAWRLVGSLEDGRVGKQKQNAMLRAVDEPGFGTQDSDAGALRADQRASDMEAVLRQKVVEVVAGDATWDVRELLANERGVLVTEVAQLGVEFAFAPTLLNDALEFALGGGADGEAGAVVEQDVELFDVFAGFAAEHGVRTAGVVADHAADRAVLVRGRVGGEGERVLLRGGAQVIVDDAGVDPGVLLFWVELFDGVEVLGKVEDDGRVGGLAGERGAGATAEEGHVVLAAGSNGGDHVVEGFGDDDAHGDLAVVREVGGVEGALTGGETDLGGGGVAEAPGELFGDGGTEDRKGVRGGEVVERKGRQGGGAPG